MGEEQKIVNDSKVCDSDVAVPPSTSDENKPAEVIRAEQILKAKELYSHGSRNFLVKSYTEAAEELSEVCRIFDDLYGNLSDELGMPYLLYAKSLIALALDENKVIDVPDEEEDDEDDDDIDDVDDEVAEGEANGEAATSTSTAKTNGSEKPMENAKAEEISNENKSEEADSTENSSSVDKTKESEPLVNGKEEETAVSSTDGVVEEKSEEKKNDEEKVKVIDDDKPSTSKGQTENGEGADDVADEGDDEQDGTSNLQLAWEVLELADKIFSRQGESGLPNLAEVKTELANISFENNALEVARSDYEKALKIYADLPNNYRRAKAEIHYKIGLTFLMQQLNKEGADSLKKACDLIEEEIEDIKTKEEQTEKEKNTIQDLEETKQEIWVKIAEIEETEAQTIAEVRAALDTYIKPFAEVVRSSEAGPSSSSVVISSSSSNSNSAKPTDISHLIKRKKMEDQSDEAEEVAASPAKKAALSEN